MAVVSSSVPVIYINAQIYTGEKIDPINNAFMVAEGRFAKLGMVSEILKAAPSNVEVVDLKNARVMPGFIDSHGHLVGLGKSRQMLDLRGKMPDEIMNLVLARAQDLAPGSWIVGRGWDQNLWPNKSFPVKEMFTSLKDSHFVCLRRVDGHGVWLNRAALKVCGITKDTKDPPGGQIICDHNKEPTGVLIDHAMALVERHLEKPTHAELATALDLAMAELAGLGITSFHDAGSTREHIELFKNYAERGKLTVRIYAMLDGDDEALVAEYLPKGPQKVTDFLAVRSIKYFADGALGSRGAALLKDYHDQPGQRGLLLMDKDKLAKKASIAIAHGFQVATHAIGDEANQMVLDAYEQVLPKGGLDLRLRIEHAQLIDPSDLERFKKLSVIASMQPIHCTKDMGWVVDRLGSKRTWDRAYPWRSLLNSGAKLVFGSDAPVESANPMWGLYAAVTRQDERGMPPRGFMPEQTLALDEALQAYYFNGAHAEFSEQSKGRIAEGFLADFVVFSEDILDMPPSKLRNAMPQMTVVGGKVVFCQSCKKSKINSR